MKVKVVISRLFFNFPIAVTVKFFGFLLKAIEGFYKKFVLLS